MGVTYQYKYALSIKNATAAYWLGPCIPLANDENMLHSKKPGSGCAFFVKKFPWAMCTMGNFLGDLYLIYIFFKLFFGFFVCWINIYLLHGNNGCL